MPLWLPGLGGGLLLGLVGTGLKFLLTNRLLKRVAIKEQKKMKQDFLNYFYLRQALNIIILVLVYFVFAKKASILIGTALGLTLPEIIITLGKFLFYKD